MNEIQLAQLRDEAIECLPAAQKTRDNFKQWQRVTHLNRADYAIELYRAAQSARCDATLSHVEIAATHLLEAVCAWQLYDPKAPGWEDIDPTEHRANCMRKIAESAEALAKVTGRTMPLDYVEPADAPAVKKEAGAAILIHKLKTKNMPLDAEIATAKTRALDKTNVQSVWDELVKMANKQEGCLIGEGDLNELQYGSRQAPQIFTKKMLTDRMRERKNRAKPR